MTSLLSGDLTSWQPAAGFKFQHMDKGKILREMMEHSKSSKGEAIDETQVLEEREGNSNKK